MTLTAKAPAHLGCWGKLRQGNCCRCGTLPNRRGSITIDDEGTPSSRNVLIEDGILVDLQDRQTFDGVDPTGNGRRQSYAHAPMPRMTNTIMEGGNATPAELLTDLKDGFTPWALAAY